VDLTAEERRLRDARTNPEWRLSAPYLSERQWGTVREDYSETGDAWDYFTHDESRSRAYNGAGLGASHQTGWTGLVTRLIQLSSSVTPEEVLEGDRRPLSRPYRRLTGAPIGDVATARESRGAPR